MGFTKCGNIGIALTNFLLLLTTPYEEKGDYVQLFDYKGIM